MLEANICAIRFPSLSQRRPSNFQTLFTRDSKIDLVDVRSRLVQDVP